MIALDRIGLFGLLHLAGQQTDVGDEMLRAGMVAAGQMNVDRRVERDARLAPLRDLFGMALGVGGGEFAAGVAGAGDQAAADRVGLDGEAERLDLLFGGVDLSQSARRRSAGSARPSGGYRRRRNSRATSARPRICATVRRPTGTTTPIQFRPSCFCG